MLKLLRHRQVPLYFALTALLAACGGNENTASTTTPLAIMSPTTVPAPTPVLALLAGNMGGTGSADGVGPTASFAYPQGVATDGAGNIYVADTANNTIRKLSPSGVVTTLAGTPTPWASTFNYPTRVATDSAGNVFVADTNAGTIQKITASGELSTLVSGLNGPRGIAVDKMDNVFVAETYNNAILKVTPEGAITTFAGTAASWTFGSSDGTGSAASFHSPMGIAIDTNENIYVADTYNNTIRKITQKGEVTTFAGTVNGDAGCSGSEDGAGWTAYFCNPSDVATDSLGNVYVADEGNHTIRKIAPDGMVATLAGHASLPGFSDGIGSAASFANPTGIATDIMGNVYVGDRWNNSIRKITPDGHVTTLAGVGGRGASFSDGIGTEALFWNPTGITADQTGSMYVADTSNNTIRKITQDGVVTTLAGKRELGSADGIKTAARFNAPNGVATDSIGNIYVADTNNHTVRRITPDGVVTTFAGSPNVPGSSDGTGAEARFNKPTGVAIDGADNIYVTDNLNFTIRKISPGGVVTTLAGVVGKAGHADGIGAAASFNYPTGIAVDSEFNVYVVDTFNQVIRKITPDGLVTTLAGISGVIGSDDGDALTASFYNPTGIVLDTIGNTYVADSGNNTIRKIAQDGIVSTVVGVAGQLGFSPGNLPGVLWHPATMTFIDRSLYVTSRNGIVVVSNVP